MKKIFRYKRLCKLLLTIAFSCSLLISSGCENENSDSIESNLDLSVDLNSYNAEAEVINNDGDSDFESTVAKIDDSIILKIKKSDGEWQKSIDANLDNIVDCRISYTNQSNVTSESVIIRISLPDNVEYINKSTVLYNSNFPDGATTDDDTIAKDGINIGDYLVNGSAYVDFKAKLVDNGSLDKVNKLIIWSKVSANGEVGQDCAEIYCSKSDIN